VTQWPSSNKKLKKW